MNKRIVSALAVVIVLAGLGGVWAVGQQKHTTSTTKTTATATPTATVAQSTASATSSHTLSYKGEEGKTALELLKQHDPTAQTKGEGTNAYVTSIGGYTANDAKHEYWEMLVNGQSSSVGAGSYTTKSTDTVEWKIATY